MKSQEIYEFKKYTYIHTLTAYSLFDDIFL